MTQKKRTILFGGENEKEEKLNDTWEWDGAKWKQIEIIKIK
jgi:hypothetical protein